MPIYFNNANKKWYIQVVINGKKYRCYSTLGTRHTFKKKSEAAAYEPAFVSSLYGDSVRTEIVIDEDYLDDFYSYMKTKLKPSTYYGYWNTFVNYWKPIFMGLPISLLNNQMLETFSHKVFRHPTNHQGKSASGKLFVKFLKKVKPELDDSFIEAPKKSDSAIHEYNIYSEEKFSRFFSVIEDKRDQMLFLILFHYGLRISECLALMWNDIKPDGLHIERSACVKNDTGKVIFTSPKTKNSYRVYPLIKPLLPYFEDQSLKKGSRFLFPGKKENHPIMGQSSVRRKVRQYAKLAGVKEIRLHEFRHSCVSNLLMHKQPVRLVARWVGDTESMVLNTYSHLLPNEKSVIADFMNSLDDDTDDNE